jgi:hypothetical protein
MRAKVFRFIPLLVVWLVSCDYGGEESELDSADTAIGIPYEGGGYDSDPVEEQKQVAEEPQAEPEPEPVADTRVDDFPYCKYQPAAVTRRTERARTQKSESRAVTTPEAEPDRDRDDEAPAGKDVWEDRATWSNPNLWRCRR